MTRQRSSSDRVEIICASRELFGADRSALRLADVLRGLGWSPTIVVPNARPERGLGRAALSRGHQYEEADVAVASRRGIEGFGAFAPRTRSALPDLTIVNSAAVLTTLGATQRKIIVVREWLRPRSVRHRILVARHRRGAEALVCVSNGVLRQWREVSRGPSRQYVIPNWLDQSVLDATAGSSRRLDDRGGILFLGRLNKWKGYDALADAWEEAFAHLSQRPTLTFVGAQPDSEFAAAGERLAERGRHWGWKVLPFDETPKLHLSAASLVVVPSLHPEPFGGVILEALAHGCRVLAFSGGGPSDLAPAFEHALTVIPRSTASLTAALAAWWHEGGLAQDAEQLLRTDRVLDEVYSPTAAMARWDRIL